MNALYKNAMNSVRDWDAYIEIIYKYKWQCKYIQESRRKEIKERMQTFTLIPGSAPE